ncbi:DUF421 domain-containing protein [Pedobacter paludis]|uniref:YetF C-terminal domain-containing protein n=1 Tax=Pedobacter paludis TaxID=2203212 RepID=A0A317F1N6_9SPHI|nr:YetF domain-containing protein [Pedobacter paludis]PWS32685.1 hypothetical protein DF947_06330 [Pedobacter paludis]
MKNIVELFGKGSDLSVLQMSIRAVVVFLAAYIFIRLSGRRSFALRSPLDNIIVILLGAILSRAVVGASPFLPVMAASLAIVILHRLLAWITSTKSQLARIITARRILLYDHGRFIDTALKKALISQEDIREKIRQSLHSDSLEQVDQVYMERDGQISIITNANGHFIQD